MSSPWWYGILLFPVVVVTTLLSRVGSRTFIALTPSGGDPNVAAAVASFILTVAAFWGGIVVALVVLGCLLADIRTLGSDGEWSPSVVWSLAGLAHLGAAVFSPLLAVSVPTLTYYLYRRHDRLGRS